MKLITIELSEVNGQDTLTWQTDQQGVEVLDRLIDALGTLRATIVPPVRQEDPVPGAQLEAIEDPRWMVGAELSGVILLSLRHPGFGWLTFRLPAASAVPLHQQLQRFSEPLPPTLAH